MLHFDLSQLHFCFCVFKKTRLCIQSFASQLQKPFSDKPISHIKFYFTFACKWTTNQLTNLCLFFMVYANALASPCTWTGFTVYTKEEVHGQQEMVMQSTCVVPSIEGYGHLFSVCTHTRVVSLIDAAVCRSWLLAGVPMTSRCCLCLEHHRGHLNPTPDNAGVLW